MHGILPRMKMSSTLLSCFAASLLLIGCATSTPQQPGPVADDTSAVDPLEQLIAAGQFATAASLLESEAAQTGDPEERISLRFQAAHLYTRAEDSASLLQLIGDLEAEIQSEADRWHLRVLQAQWHLLRREPLLALGRTQIAPPASIDNALRLRTAMTRADALTQLQDGVAAMQALIDVRPGLDNVLETQRLASIAQLLQNRDVFWLQPPGMISGRMQGWLALGEITRRMWGSEAELDQAMSQWRTRFVDHPGMQVTASLREQAAAVIRSAPRRVALLLPLSGPLAEVGEAIRDGFVAAYMDNREHRLQVQFYDTHSLQPQVAFDAAVANGADLIVGPLKKDMVAEVAALNAFGLPQLALNSAPESAQQRPWLLSLALPPEDDATAAARLALQHGHKRVVALRGPATWTERSTTAFGSTLEEGGGRLMDAITFESKNDSYPAAIKALMQLERSQDRAARIQHALGTPVLYDLERRQDTDALYLAADITDARQIRPQIRFYQGSDLPIYASGRLFDGDRSRFERDLDGVSFCSSPWLLGTSEGWQAKRADFQQWQPQADQRWARFHAVGHDAYQLATRVRRGGWPQGLSIAGASGELQITGESVQRRLPCAVYRNGRPEGVTTP